MTVVKICGLTRPEDVECVNRLRPDMAGFVFYGPSRRCVDAEKASVLSGMLDTSIKPVGVFVDEDPLVIADLVDRGVISAIQLHGVEDDSYIRGLRGLVDVPVIKAFCIHEGRDLVHIRDSTADLVLLDSGKGSGRGFDWDLIGDLGRDYILSGGLSPDNVADAVRRMNPYGVDVSSGVETGGVKDSEKIARFIRYARSARFFSS